MRKNLKPFRIVVYALCALSLASFRAYGQDRNQDRDKDNHTDRPNGIVRDWSRRYALYPRVGPLKSLVDLQNDPRAILSWQEESRKDWRRWRNPRHPREEKSTLATDWHIRMSASTTTSVFRLNTFPAKYTFVPTDTPNCANDFIVYSLNAGFAVENITGTLTTGLTTVTVTAGTITAVYAGQPITGTGIPAGTTIASITGSPATSLTLSAAATAPGSQALKVSGQPNLVILNNLYSGSTPNGICNRTPSGTDDGVSATVAASYYMHADGGQAPTSVALSLDGTEIALIESAPGHSALFEVITPRAGDGVDPTNSQNVLLPFEENSFDTASVVQNPGQASATGLGTAADTNSALFVDYIPDLGYVGDDSGKLYRLTNVFCTLSACLNAGGGRPAPALDPSWGTGGVLTTGCPGALSGPVVDSSKYVFVGCSDGKVYGYTTAGVALTGSPITVGDGTARGGIVDPPLVDVIRDDFYVASASSAGGTSVVAQIHATGTTMTLVSTATLDGAFSTGTMNLHSPAFNEDYFLSVNPSDWILFEYSPNTNTTTSVWGMGFGAGHVMNSGTPSDFWQIPGGGPFEASPLTTFFTGSNDYLFVGNTSPFLGDAGVGQYNISGNTFPTADPAFFDVEGEGTTGIVIDDISSSAQTSSIYFGVLGPSGTNENDAVKLTQSTLQ